MADGPDYKPFVHRVPVSEAKKFFAVDASDSTAGAISRAEKEAVKGFHTNCEDSIAKWGSCENPQLVDKMGNHYFKSNSGSTDPETMLTGTLNLHEILSSDIWYLLTAGTIADFEVANLAQLAEAQGLVNIPFMLLVVGDKKLGLEKTNVSVGMPFYLAAQDALMLFKDVETEGLFPIAAKGCFAPLMNSVNYASEDLNNFSSWGSPFAFPDENRLMQRCDDLGIKVVSNKHRQITKSLYLGPRLGWWTRDLAYVKKSLARTNIKSKDLIGMIEPEAFTRMAIICKTRNLVGDLRAWLERHKQEEATARDVDYTDLEMRFSVRKEIPTTESPWDETNYWWPRKVNRFIDRALGILADVENSSYDAQILNARSNRVRRGLATDPDDAGILEVTLCLADDVEAFRGTCSICCDDNQIMSIGLKSLDTIEENTTDFALNFPLAAGQANQITDIISSQCVCYECAVIARQSIFREPLSAIIPTVNYQGPNKPYMTHQLTTAFTAGFATRLAGICQIFMAVLDRTLETKAWCADQSGLEEDKRNSETSTRRGALNFMLVTLFKNCKIRANFSEKFNDVSPLVDYPQALRRVIGEFQLHRVQSWVIQYPLLGFVQMFRLLDILSPKVPSGIMDAMLRAKLMHFVVVRMINEQLRAKPGDERWTHPYLHLIYKGFNAPGVPQDMGSATLVQAEGFWGRLEVVLGQQPVIKRFLGLFRPDLIPEAAERIQLTIFWFLRSQKCHTLPETFFQHVLPMANGMLDPFRLYRGRSEQKMFKSLFFSKRPTNDCSHPVHCVPPFVSPYGPSVLECGEPSCPVQFYLESDANSLDLDALRRRRATHLTSIYGGMGFFRASKTGMPEPTFAPFPPISDHCDLHISIAKVWSRLRCYAINAVSQNRSRHSNCKLTRSDLPSREEIMNGDEHAVAAFVTEVLVQICVRSQRGNIYRADLDANVRGLLPSFRNALRVASEKLGLADRSGMAFEHDFTHNSLLSRVGYELSLREWFWKDELLRKWGLMA